MTARIPLADPQTMDARQREVYDTIVNGPRGQLVGPLRAVLLIPELADRWQRFGEQLRYNTSIDPRWTELAIIITARHWNSQVEWQIHSQAAERAGLSLAVITSIGYGDLPEFENEVDGEIYEFTRQLLSNGDVDAALHARLAARWSAAAVVELTAVIGYYSMVSMMLNAQAIPPVDGIALLPPANDAPRVVGAVTPLPPFNRIA